MSSKNLRIYTAHYANGTMSFVNSDMEMAIDHAKYANTGKNAWGTLLTVKFVGVRSEYADTSDLGKFNRVVTLPDLKI